MLHSLSEFLGTFLFLFFAFSGTALANSSPDQPQLLTLFFIALSFGLALGANVWAFFRLSGGQFNPAVSLSLFLTGNLSVAKLAVNIPAQILGGVAATAVVSGLYPDEGVAVNTALGAGTSVAQGLFIEVFLTAQLVLVILFAAVDKHPQNRNARELAPLAIGAAFFLTQLVGVNFTGGSLNPARSLGPAIVLGRWPGYFWIYILGPVMGAALASAAYKLLVWLRVEEQDEDVDEQDLERGSVSGKTRVHVVEKRVDSSSGCSGEGH